MGLDAGIQALKDNNSDKAFRSGWTQQQLGPLSAANPGKNIMVTCVKHDASQLQGFQHQDRTCDCPSGNKYHYDVYIFDAGLFVHQGDGGFLNWAFCGNFVRDGDKVSSKPSPTSSSSRRGYLPDN